jgi:hypothetical protein
MGALPNAQRPTPARPARLVQRLEPMRRGAPVQTLDSEHFDVVYDPNRLTTAQAEEARALAEKGWEHCAKRFGTEPAGKIRLDLTPAFVGATGFAAPVNPESRRPRSQPLIGVRYADLDYLGLTGEYVLSHEIAHIFSGKLAGTTLGEGIADWASSGFAGIPMRPWWGKALRDGGLWIDPTAFFLTGEFEHSPEVDAVIRTAQYVEAGLLVHFLVERFGWEKFKAFAGDYGEARGRLIGNEERRRMRVNPRGRREGERDPRLPPEGDAVRAAFERHFGTAPGKLMSEWERTFEAETPPPGELDRLVLGQRIYGAVRNYEMWALTQRPVPGPEAQKRVREAFTEANRALARGDAPAAREALGRAQGLVDRLRRPQDVAYLGTTARKAG